MFRTIPLNPYSLFPDAPCGAGRSMLRPYRTPDERGMVINTTNTQRSTFPPVGRNQKIPIKPRPLAGWGILAHGETMGHGAKRHHD